MFKKTLLAIPLVFSLFSDSYASTCMDSWKELLTHHAELEKSSFFGLCGESLKRAMGQAMEAEQQTLHYNQAKQSLFKDVDFDDSELGPCSVYSPNHCHRDYPLNLEHTWPQSQGANKKPMISDLHHLYLAEVETNSMRSNYPFCEVERADWEYEGSKLGYAAGGRQLCFEPPVSHKGNVARSLFYFATRYSKKINRMQEDLLRRWNQLDPVNERDILRNDRIEEIQTNRNLFVDYPELVDLIDDF